MEIIDTHLLSYGLNILVALLLGTMLGVERSLAHKTAGLRTYGLVSMGSALFVVIARMVGESLFSIDGNEVMRVAAGVITGIGFLCAGVIILRDQTVVGLTTAAGLWISAGIGMAAGFGLYVIAVFATILTLLTFTLFWFLEREVTEISGR